MILPLSSKFNIHNILDLGCDNNHVHVTMSHMLIAGALHLRKHIIIIKSNLLYDSSNFPAKSAVTRNHATQDQLQQGCLVSA